MMRKWVVFRRTQKLYVAHGLPERSPQNADLVRSHVMTHFSAHKAECVSCRAAEEPAAEQSPAAVAVVSCSAAVGPC